MGEPIKNRYDFVVYFDVENGNPNGDPDSDNMPREDTESGYGFVTDVCLKRKIRNYVETVKEDKPGFEIYIKENVPLKSSDKRALESSEIKKLDKNNPERSVKIREFMCSTFYDVRTFGAVMTTFTENEFKGKLNCGQIRGPVQLSFAQSIDPINSREITLTRVTITKEEDAKDKNTEFGHKYVVPYALYRCEGYISANLARKTTGFSEEDLSLLWEAIINMFENDRSAAHGKMSVRALVVFKHDSELGNAPSYQLFDLVSVEKHEGIEVPRSFDDYDKIKVDATLIPKGVTCKSYIPGSVDGAEEV